MSAAPGSDVPMTRDELRETVAAAICCHTRWSPAVAWEVDLVMQAVDEYINQCPHISVADHPRQTSPSKGDQVT